MSTGGPFKLITNNGKSDAMMLATDYLNARLAAIYNRKVATLVKAHNMANPGYKISTKYLLEHWKDFEMRTGTSRNTLLPTLHEIEQTHILFMNAHFKPFVAIGYEYLKTKCVTNCYWDGCAEFTPDQHGDFVADMAFRVVLKNLSAINPNLSEVDPDNPPTVSERVKYADLPGHRFFKSLSLKINNNPIDEIGPEEYNEFYNFHVLPDKQASWEKCMGQEVPIKCYLTPNPFGQFYREVRHISNGAQTLKAVHTSLEMWIPAIFWCRDFRTAIPNVALPYGSLKLFARINSVTNLAAAVNNGTAGVDGEFVPFNAPDISACELYVNHIFMNPEIHDIFMQRIGFTLIRVHKRQEQLVSDQIGHVLLHNIKYPIEFMSVAFRPPANEESIDYWHKNCILTKPGDDGTEPICMAGAQFNTSTQECNLIANEAVLRFESPVITSLGVSAHGIDLFKPTSPTFFSHYTPYQYGKGTLASPKDNCLYFIPFNLYPGIYQPSGHLNTSRARELYINYESDFIGQLPDGEVNKKLRNKAKLIVIVSCINFILYSQGSGVLRFAV